MKLKSCLYKLRILHQINTSLMFIYLNLFFIQNTFQELSIFSNILNIHSIMLRSRKQTSSGSLNQEGKTYDGNSKKYRCECCKDKRHHDYNRQNRLKRQLASSKRMNLTYRQSNRYPSEQNSMNVRNTCLINSVQAYQVKTRKSLSLQKLSVIQQSPKFNQNHLNKDNDSRIRTPIVNMKSYCKGLFSNSKKATHNNRIIIRINNQTYFIDLISNEKMKLAIGQLKLLIQKSQSEGQNIK